MKRLEQFRENPCTGLSVNSPTSRLAATYTAAYTSSAASLHTPQRPPTRKPKRNPISEPRTEEVSFFEQRLPRLADSSRLPFRTSSRKLRNAPRIGNPSRTPQRAPNRPSPRPPSRKPRNAPRYGNPKADLVPEASGRDPNRQAPRPASRLPSRTVAAPTDSRLDARLVFRPEWTSRNGVRHGRHLGVRLGAWRGSLRRPVALFGPGAGAGTSSRFGVRHVCRSAHRHGSGVRVEGRGR